MSLNELRMPLRRVPGLSANRAGTVADKGTDEDTYEGLGGLSLRRVCGQQGLCSTSADLELLDLLDSRHEPTTFPLTPVEESFGRGVLLGR